MIPFAEALKISKSPLVPQTVIMGGTDGKTPNAMEGIMSMVLANMANARVSGETKEENILNVNKLEK